MRQIRKFALPGGATLPLRVQVPGIDGKEFWKLLSPEPGCEVEGQILCAQPWTCWIHFDRTDRQITPCWKEAIGQCEQCRGCQRRFAAYLCVYSPKWKSRCLVHVTRWGFEHCPALHDENADLRGKRIRVSRGYRGTRDKVTCRIEEPAGVPFDPRWFVEPSDIMAQMLHIWGVQLREQ